MRHFDDRADAVVHFCALAELNVAFAVFLVVLGDFDQPVRQVGDADLRDRIAVAFHRDGAGRD